MIHLPMGEIVADDWEPVFPESETAALSSEDIERRINTRN